jgi:pimeloyl-ACP methyl ester carboxylesterase
MSNASSQDTVDYYSFSFNEMGIYDQPALWKYILKETGQEKLTYIGHSQGTMQMFIAMQEYPQFFKKHMHKFVAIAPVWKISNATSPTA